MASLAGVRKTPPSEGQGGWGPHFGNASFSTKRSLEKKRTRGEEFSPRRLVEPDGNQAEIPVGKPYQHERESGPVLVKRTEFFPVFLLERGGVPAVTKDDHHLDRSTGFDQPYLDLPHDLGERLRLLAAPPRSA